MGKFTLRAHALVGARIAEHGQSGHIRAQYGHIRATTFVLGQGNLSAAETAHIVIRAHRKMLRAARGARRSAIFTLMRDGQLRRLL
jgi:hypothetical protein